MLVTDIVLVILMFWLASFLTLKFTGTYDLVVFVFCGGLATILFCCMFVFSRFLANVFMIG